MRCNVPTMKRALFPLVALFLTSALADEQTVYIFRSGKVTQQIDPYAELKAAHRAGEVIQHRENHLRDWIDIPNPKWTSPAYCYQVKPAPIVPIPPAPLPNVKLPSNYIAPPTKTPVDPYLEALKKGMQEREKQRQQEALDRLADQVEIQSRILFQLQYGQK